MGTIPPSELLKLWQLEKITLEMAIGHLIQNLVNVRNTQDGHEISIRSLQSKINQMTEIINGELQPRKSGKVRKSK